MEKNFNALVEAIKSLREAHDDTVESFVDYIMSDSGEYDILTRVRTTDPWSDAQRQRQHKLASRLRVVLVTHCYHDPCQDVNADALLEVIQDEYKALKKEEAQRIVSEAMKAASAFGVFLSIQCEGDKDIYLPPSSAYTASYKAGLLKK